MTTEPTQDVFELTLVRAVGHEAGEDAVLAHLWWKATSQGERLVQVYVDDELTDVSMTVDQREMWLMLDRSSDHRVELLAVDADDADGLWVSHVDLLQAWQPAVTDVASIWAVRDERVAADADVSVLVDGGVVDEAALWPADVSRSGFGAVFGEGGFGTDTATGPGLGMGELGFGPLGADGTGWRWRRADLATGEHALILAVQEGSAPATQADLGTVMIARLAPPAKDLAIGAGFELSWSV